MSRTGGIFTVLDAAPRDDGAYGSVGVAGDGVARSRGAAGSSETVQLVFLAPQSLPRIRVDSRQPRRVEARVLVSAPPLLLPGMRRPGWPPLHPNRRTAAQVSTGRPKRGERCRHSKYAAVSPPAIIPSRAARPRNNPGGRTPPRERVKTRTATGSCGSIELLRSGQVIAVHGRFGPQPLTVCPKRPQESDATPAGAAP